MLVFVYIILGLIMCWQLGWGWLTGLFLAAVVADVILSFSLFANNKWNMKKATSELPLYKMGYKEGFEKGLAEGKK